MHSLLTSPLAKADSACSISATESRSPANKRKKTPQGCLSSFGSGTRIRTQTYRVRVCCATFTQFRYCFTSVNDFTIKFAICQGVFQKKSGRILFFSKEEGNFLKKESETYQKMSVLVIAEMETSMADTTTTAEVSATIAFSPYGGVQITFPEGCENFPEM